MADSALLKKLRAPGPKRILALDGGGIRGILTLGYLERLEDILRKRYKKPDFLLCDYFDLIGGTSTGSIIASGLAIGMSVAEIKKNYFELGNVIFGTKKNMLTYISQGQKYDSRPLERALKKVFGDITLGDQERIKTGLCVVTKRAETFSTWPLINHPEGKFYDANKDYSLWKVVRASVAAPTFFLPLVLDVGPKEKGSFIDGGVSMSNNPSLRMFLLATLKGYPFHWEMGPEKLMIVSVGTGIKDHKYDFQNFKKSSVLGWAAMLPEIFMVDATYYNQLILQILSESPTAIEIDMEVGNLKGDHLNGKHALYYLRYNVTMEKSYLDDLGFSFSKKQISKLSAMDNAQNVNILAMIGEKAAEKYLKPRHIPKIFDINNKDWETPKKRYVSGKKVPHQFEKVVKNPIPVGAVQINEPFEVETLEGVMQGKPGDYLMKGIKGEYYVCERKIFEETYHYLEEEEDPKIQKQKS